MGREGTRATSSRKKSPKKGPPPVDETKASDAPAATNDDEVMEPPATPSEHINHHHHHPLARVTGGMNRKSLQTGYYGSKGERIRHVVASGALLMPEEALEIMESFEDKSTKRDEGKAGTKQRNKKRKAETLPGLDSVVRPSMDKSLEKIIVTDVFHKSYVNQQDPTQPPSVRTVAANRYVELVGKPDAERIRGGGDDEATPTTQSTQARALSASSNPSSGQEATRKDPPADPPGASTSAPAPAAPQQPVAQTTTSMPASAPSSTVVPSSSPASAPIPPTTASASAPTSSSSAGASAPTPTPAPPPAPTTPVKASSSATPPAPSSATKPAEAATDKVIPLTKKPEPHWEQHIPSANDENLTDPEAKTPKPGWYNSTTVSNLERTLLPEWFDSSASHRTVETYLKARETMIHISQQLGNRFVTSTLARRSLPGDVGSLHRLHNFLTCYLWMNEEGRNDSAPTAPSLQQPPQLVGKVWTEKRRGDLLEAVVEVSQQQQQQQNKKQKTDSFEENTAMEVDNDVAAFVTIDWDTVALKVGATAGECEREFLAMPMDDASIATTTERPLTPDTTASTGSRAPRSSKDEMAQEELIRSLVEETSPNVIRAVTEAALEATTNQNLPAAQKAARLGLVAGQAAQAAQAHEETVSRLLSEVIDQRMQKLECRMALMDDLEGMLEAERVALELERRDLYTTRCRDWFGSN